MAVLGQLMLEQSGRGRAQRELLYGLPVLRTSADPEGFWGERRVRRAGQTLWRGGVVRTLTPPEFNRWDLLAEYGLTGVETIGFLRAQSTALTLALLQRQGLDPKRATVALCGARVDREMTRAAAALCVQVRHLVVSAPRGGGELALWLRREFGVPVLPEGETGQVALRFHPARRTEASSIDLFGTQPDLNGLLMSAPALGQADREHLPLLAALWEGGRLGAEALKIT